MSVTENLLGERTPETTAEAAQASEYEGHVNEANPKLIWGWAWDRLRPTLPITIRLASDQGFSAVILADGFRTDLRQKGGGHHAFRYPVPRELCDGRVHQIRMTYEDSDQVLAKGSFTFGPFGIPLPSPGTAPAGQDGDAPPSPAQHSELLMRVQALNAGMNAGVRESRIRWLVQAVRTAMMAECHDTALGLARYLVPLLPQASAEEMAAALLPVTEALNTCGETDTAARLLLEHLPLVGTDDRLLTLLSLLGPRLGVWDPSFATLPSGLPNAFFISRNLERLSVVECFETGEASC
jgi:hypothetical protein